MPLIDILGTLDNILEDPAWLMFGLAGGVALLGFLLLMLYPLGKD